MELFLATTNQGKIREIKEMLKGLDLNILLLEDFSNLPEVEETGKTFKDNAILKAAEFSGLTGKLTLAEDSGLEVEALGDAPGVYSARFAGEKANDEENNLKLLELLGDLPLPRRKASYKCVMALVSPEGWTKTSEGACHGLIGYKPEGKFGFGYDPLFIIPAYNRTFGQLDPAIKNKLSHRSEALKKMQHIIEEIQAGLTR